MKKTSIVYVAAIFVSFFLHGTLTTNAQTKSGGIKLGFVKTLDDGAGDWIWLASARRKDRVDRQVIAKIAAEGIGRINVNGRDVQLRVTKYYLPDKNFKVGRGGYEIWRGKDLFARLDYVFTWLCPSQNDNCEVYHFKGVLDIKYKGARRKVSVVGEGGS